MMALSGVSTIWRTLDRMVMTETYRSPPVAARTLLQQIVTTLLVSCMMKPAVPKLRISRRQAKLAASARGGRRRRRYSALVHRKNSTNAAERTWESTVATAAPATPMPSAKMKIGSRTRFAAAPITTLVMPMVT